MKRKATFVSVLLAAVLLFLLPTGISAENNAVRSAADSTALYGEAKSVILIEAATGRVLYEHEADVRLPPASVTKVMTLLLIAEEIDRGTMKLTDTVQVSDNASHMGGSQVYLKAGEEMSVEDLLKSVIIASANDAATALAEQAAGSVEEFVIRMNQRAKELGMENTVFENPTGLDDSTVDHKTTARDIAIMSRELMKHEFILNYTTIWMDTIRNGAFGLTNTNRLIRFYSGANGLKTGSTHQAGFCISAAAKRDGMQLIAVIMGAPNRDSRNVTAKRLLDYGFANYRYVFREAGDSGEMKVLGGVSDNVKLTHGEFGTVLEKGEAANGIEEVVNLPESIDAPVKAGDVVGTIDYKAGDTVIGSVEIRAAENVARIGFGGLLARMFGCFCVKG